MKLKPKILVCSKIYLFKNLNFLKNILGTSLFKVLSLNRLSIVLKIILGFASSKLIAIFIGPSGLAIIGNFKNFLTSTEAIGTLGFENGIIKYTAENRNDEEKLKQTLSTVFFSVLTAIIILSCFIFFFSNYLNFNIFGFHYPYQIYFKVLALVLPIYIGNLILLTILNGLQQFKKVILINVIGNCLTLILAFVFIQKFGLKGAIFNLVIAPAVLFFVSVYFLNQQLNLTSFIKLSYFNISVLKKLSSFTLMTLFAALAGSLVLLTIRKNIISTLGIEQAGFYEAMNRNSNYYFIFISSIISLYFLPKMAIAKDKFETKSLIFDYYKKIIPIFILGLLLIYFFRNQFILILLSKEFLPCSKLFFWQLLGDFFKALSLILGFQFFAKKLTKQFLIFETISLILLYFSTHYFMHLFKIEGVVIGYAFTYVFYFIFLIIFFRRSLFF